MQKVGATISRSRFLPLPLSPSFLITTPKEFTYTLRVSCVDHNVWLNQQQASTVSPKKVVSAISPYLELHWFPLSIFFWTPCMRIPIGPDRQIRMTDNRNYDESYFL